MQFINKVILLAFLTFCSIVTIAQIPNDYHYQDFKKENPKENFIFTKISVEDIIELEKGEISIRSHHREELLCLNKNIQGLAERSVWYDQFSVIENLAASCYYPENGKYKKEKVKVFEDQESISSGISFYDDSRKKIFRYQNLREGAVTIMEYDRIITDYHLLNSRRFSKGAFIVDETYTLKVHKDIDLGIKTFNMDSTIHFTKVQEGNYTIYHWEKLNGKKEPVYGNEDYRLYYEPVIIPYIKSYQQNGEKKVVFDGVEGLYAWYWELINKVEKPQNEQLKNLADSLVQGKESELEKVEAIYKWVQNNIKYIAFGDGYGGFVPRNPDQIYEKRFGDCKDMSCLIISLLKELDITAHFTWVGTRLIPFLYTDLATPQVDNHMIATYFDQEGKPYYLDATDSDLFFGRPSYAIQGKQVLISFDEDSFQLRNIDTIPSSINIEYEKAKLQLEGRSIKGTAECLYTGYLAAEVIDDFRDLKKEDEKDLIKLILEKGSNKFLPGEYKISQPNNSKDSCLIEYDFVVEDYVTKVGNAYYLNLNLTKQPKSLDIDKKRNIPQIFDYQNKLIKSFSITLPDDAKIEYLPKSVYYSSSNFNYKIEYKVNANHIDYYFEMEMLPLLLMPEEVESWNKKIKELGQALDESIKFTRNE